MYELEIFHVGSGLLMGRIQFTIQGPNPVNLSKGQNPVYLRHTIRSASDIYMTELVFSRIFLLSL